MGMVGVMLRGSEVRSGLGKGTEHSNRMLWLFGEKLLTGVLFPMEDYNIFTTPIPGVWPLPALSRGAQARGNVGEEESSLLFG